MLRISVLICFVLLVACLFHPDSLTVVVGLGRAVCLALGVGVFFVIALALGRRFLRGSELGEGERTLFGGGIGLGCLGYAMFFAGLAGLLKVEVVVLILVVAIGVAWREVMPSLESAGTGIKLLKGEGIFGAVCFAGVALAIMMHWLECLVPVLDYDALEYHLGALSQYLSIGKITFLPRNVYAAFPANTEMLYFYGLLLTGSKVVAGWCAKAINLGFALLTAGVVYHIAEKLKRGAGVVTVAIYLVTPTIAELATVNVYIECSLSFYGALVVLGLVNLMENGERRYAYLAGLSAGLACAVKYPSVVFWLLPCVMVVAVLSGGRRIRTAVGALLIAVVIALPWYLKNLFYTGNPVYPLLWDVFDGKSWDGKRAEKFRKAHSPGKFSLKELGGKFFSFSLHRKSRTPVSLLAFGFVPFALMGLRRQARLLLAMILAVGVVLWLRLELGSFLEKGRSEDSPLWLVVGGVAVIALIALCIGGKGSKEKLLGSFFAYCFVVWFCVTHRVDRFLEPALVSIVPLSALGFLVVRERGVKTLAEVLMSLLLGYNTLLVVEKALYAGVFYTSVGEFPPEAFIAQATRHTTYSAEAIYYLNHELPPGSKVLFVGEARVYYCDRSFEASTVFDSWLLSEVLERAETPTEILEELKRRGFTHIYVNYPEMERLRSTYNFTYEGRKYPGVPERISAKLFRQELSSGLTLVWPGMRVRLLRRSFEIYEIR